MPKTSIARIPKDPLDGYEVITETGCWIWLRSIVGRVAGSTRNGYGIFSAKGKQIMAHRWFYEKFVGPIPDGLEIDHLCRISCCVNPKHLEPVTHLENIRRSPLIMKGPRSAQSNRELLVCSVGHPLDYHRPDGRGRQCKICKYTRVKERRAKNPLSRRGEWRRLRLAKLKRLANEPQK